MVDFWWQTFCLFSPGKIGLQFVTEIFITFFTARKFCRLELTLGASSPNICIRIEFKFDNREMFHVCMFASVIR